MGMKEYKESYEARLGCGIGIALVCVCIYFIGVIYSLLVN